MASLDKKFGGRDSVVGIVFRYVLEGSEFEYFSNMFRFSLPLQTSPWPTHPLLKWVLGLFPKDIEGRA
jgi:hypothetical protein